MSWLRQHCHEGHVVAVTHVSHEGMHCTLVLVEPGQPAGETVGSYPSRDQAFAAAEAIVRARYGHGCGRTCSGWTEAPPPASP